MAGDAAEARPPARRRVVGAAVVLGLVLAAALLAMMVLGSQIEARLAPEGGLQPIPSWWLASQSPPPDWDCGQSDGGSCSPAGFRTPPRSGSPAR